MPTSMSLQMQHAIRSRVGTNEDNRHTLDCDRYSCDPVQLSSGSFLSRHDTKIKRGCEAITKLAWSFVVLALWYCGDLQRHLALDSVVRSKGASRHSDIFYAGRRNRGSCSVRLGSGHLCWRFCRFRRWRRRAVLERYDERSLRRAQERWRIEKCKEL